MKIMKKQVKNLVIGIAVSMILLVTASFTAEKIFVLKFTESDLNKHFQKLSAVKQIVDNSNMSHQDALFITRTIDSLQLEMISQVKAQLDNAPKK
jgi:hypothetical protein